MLKTFSKTYGIAQDLPARVANWTPKSILLLQHYSRAAFLADLIAGVTVGLVALPLAMAFAISSGVLPQAGLYCAVITGLVISALGGSRFQIGGPTGAFVVVVAGIVATYGIDGLFMCTMMAGVILVVLGLTGTGTAVRYIPRPVGRSCRSEYWQVELARAVLSGEPLDLHLEIQA